MSLQFASLTTGSETTLSHKKGGRRGVCFPRLTLSILKPCSHRPRDDQS